MAITLGHPTTTTNIPTIRTYDASTNTWTNCDGLSDFALFPDTIGVGDRIYVGGGAPFSEINWNIATPISAVGLTLTYEIYIYENGAYAYKDITSELVDGTAGFTNTGACKQNFANCKLWNTRNGTVNGQAQNYWLRITVTAVTSSTEGGANGTTIPNMKYFQAYFDDSEFTSILPASWENLYTAMISAGVSYCHRDNPRATDNFNKSYYIPVPLYNLHTTGTGAYLKDTNCKVVTGNGEVRGNFFCSNNSYRWNLVCGELENGYGKNGCQIINQTNYQVYNASDFGAGNRFYDSKFIRTQFINPDNGYQGMGGESKYNLSGSATHYDSEFNINMYAFGGTFVGCMFRNRTLLLTNSLSVKGCNFVPLTPVISYFTQYYYSLIFEDNYFLPPTSYLIGMYGSPTANRQLCFRDARFPVPYDPAIAGYSVVSTLQDAWNFRVFFDWNVYLRCLNQEGIVQSGAKLTAYLLNATTGQFEKVDFIRYNTTDTALSSVLTSESDGIFKAGTTTKYTGVIRGLSVYRDTTNAEGYPTSYGNVYKWCPFVIFIIQKEGYKTLRVPFILGSVDSAGNYKKINFDVMLERSPYKN